MSQIRIDAYYDITCQNCGKSRSTDFSKGMEMSKTLLRNIAYKEGWVTRNGRTLCTHCAEAYSNGWQPVSEEIPVDRNESGINSRTKEKYWVIAHDGIIVKGYIYLNQYSTTGYAVMYNEDGHDVYFNNVTHWSPKDKPKKVGDNK